MLNERAIQDVAMIARNGIDRIIALERQNKRLAEALLKANAQAEHFEREWYLRGDEIERLRELSDEMFSALNAQRPSWVNRYMSPHGCGCRRRHGHQVRTRYGTHVTALVIRRNRQRKPLSVDNANGRRESGRQKMSPDLWEKYLTKTAVVGGTAS